MKKIFIIPALLIVLPSFAACPIDAGEAVCSLPGFREQLPPIYQQDTNISEFAETPEVRLNPLRREDVPTDRQGVTPAGSSFNYNSGCQFGVCMQNRSTPLFQQPKQ